MKKKVVIIGAGPAGLTAGYELLKKSNDYDVTILEADNRLGGISKTVNYKGNRMDIGGHRFFSKSQEVNDFWQEIMPVQGKPSFDDKKLKRKKTLDKGGPDPEKEDNVMLIRNRVSRIYYLRKFFDYPVSMKWETIKNLGFVRTMQSGFSYLKTYIYKKKEDCLENFYINRFGKKLYSMFFEKYTEKLWGRHPKDISADWGAQRVKGLSITAVIKDMFSKVFKFNSKHKETSLIEEYKYPKYGPGELWEEVASQIEKMGGHILKKHEVIKINNKDNRIESVICSNSGKEVVIDGDIFISSMPLKDLINGMDKVPNDIKDIGNGLPYRDFVTVGLLVKYLNLDNETKIKTLNDIVPDCWIYVQEPDVKLGRIQIFNNWSPYMVDKPEKTVWLGLEYFCSENDEFWNMDDKERVKFAISELVKMDIIDEDAVLDSHVEKVRKAYPAYFDTYKDIDKLIDYLNNYGNLYCVGRNGQHRYNNMDHSMVTSFEAVKNIINEVDNKDNIWSVNTEQDYHEENENNKDGFLVRGFKKIRNHFKNNPPTKLQLLPLFLIPFVIVCIFGYHIDNDSWFLIQHGKYVLQNGFPHIEPFTMHEGFKFVMQQWLFAIGFYLIQAKFNWYGITIIFAIINILIMFVLYKLCMLISNKNYVVSMITTVIIDSLLALNNFLCTRPQMLTYLMLIIFIYGIEKYFSSGKKRYLLILPVVSLVEINMHASMWWFLFIFSLPFIVESIVDIFIYKRKNVYSLQWFIIILCLCFVVGFINPYGVDAVIYFFLSFHAVIGDMVREMMKINVISMIGLTVIFILFINFILMIKEYNDKKYLRTSYICLLFGCLMLAFSNYKSCAYILIFAIYPFAYYFRKSDEELHETSKKLFIGRNIASIVTVVGLVIVGWYFASNYSEFSSQVSLIKEPLDYLEEHYNIEDMKLYTGYDVGAEAEARGIKTYIDARAEVFYVQMNKKYDILTEYYNLERNNYSYKEINDVFKKREFTHLLVLPNDRLFLYDEFDNYTLEKSENWYKLFTRNDLYEEKEEVVLE